MNNHEKNRPPQVKPAKSGPKPKKPLPKVGKRTVKRQAMNRKLDKLGIKRCELGFPCCVKSIMLTWAHSKKSRFLITDEDWLEACRACIPCHQQIEEMSHYDMHFFVTSAIAARKKRASEEEAA